MRNVYFRFSTHYSWGDCIHSKRKVEQKRCLEVRCACAAPLGRQTCKVIGKSETKINLQNDVFPFLTIFPEEYRNVITTGCEWCVHKEQNRVYNTHSTRLIRQPRLGAVPSVVGVVELYPIQPTRGRSCAGGLIGLADWWQHVAHACAQAVLKQTRVVFSYLGPIFKFFGAILEKPLTDVEHSTRQQDPIGQIGQLIFACYHLLRPTVSLK